MKRPTLRQRLNLWILTRLCRCLTKITERLLQDLWRSRQSPLLPSRNQQSPVLIRTTEELQLSLRAFLMSLTTT